MITIVLTLGLGLALVCLGWYVHLYQQEQIRNAQLVTGARFVYLQLVEARTHRDLLEHELERTLEYVDHLSSTLEENHQAILSARLRQARVIGEA